MAIRNRFPKTASGPESSFSLTRQAQTNRYDRRITSTIITTGAQVKLTGAHERVRSKTIDFRHSKGTYSGPHFWWALST
jgi:hypothetical protein